MSDLLNSILQNLEVPPDILKPEEKAKLRDAKEAAQKADEMQRRKLAQFRKHLHDKYGKFMKAQEMNSLRFKTMSKPFRALIHEEAAVCGLVSQSSGEEGVDRYVTVWKRGHTPNDLQQAEKEPDKILDTKLNNTQPETGCQSALYMKKYQNILERAAAYDEEDKPSSSSSYGCVPAELKQDQRTIEEILAANRAKKRKKVHNKEIDELQSKASKLD